MAQLVCDDHPLVRSALAQVVEDIAGGPVLTASDYAQAWAVAEAATPLELCVVDLHMPGVGCAEGLAGLKSRAPTAKIVVISGSDSDDDLLECLNQGVQGFVPKTVEPGVVEAALRLVLAGGRYLPERAAELARGAAPRRHSAAAPVETQDTSETPTPYGRLSARQKDVLDQMARGRSNKEIARLLGLSPATVKTHVAHILSVMGAGNRTEAAALARPSKPV